MDQAEQLELQADINKTEKAIGKCKGDLEMYLALQRLEKNRDFKKVITEGFLEAHAIRQVMLKAHPHVMGDDTLTQEIDLQIGAVGGFKQYLVGICSKGRIAEHELPQHEESLEAMLAEDVEA